MLTFFAFVSVLLLCTGRILTMVLYHIFLQMDGKKVVDVPANVFKSTFERSSYAIYVESNSSNLSKSYSTHALSFLLHPLANCQGGNPPMLPSFLAELLTEKQKEEFDQLKKSYSLHNAIERVLCIWLTSFLTSSGIKVPVVAKREFSLKSIGPDHKPEKKTDVMIYQEDGDQMPYVQFEVESDHEKSHSRNSTIIKLSYGLLDQLIYLRNRSNCTITEISGFYVSIHGHFEKVTVRWTEDRYSPFKFECFTAVVSLSNIQSTIIEAIECVLNLKLKSTSLGLSIPLNPSTVADVWGINAVQLPSSFSIVIQDDKKRIVYKHSFNSIERSRSVSLYKQFTVPAPVRKPTRFSIPLEINIDFPTLTELFCSYLLYKSPWPRHIAKKYIVFFIREVVECLTELHSFGIAHLDVRLENICFTKANKAILIDLDRSQPSDTSVEMLNLVSRKSSMYQPPFLHATAEHLDWKQVSIMVLFILSEEIHMPYHKITIVRESDGVDQVGKRKTPLKPGEISEDDVHMFIKRMFFEGIVYFILL